MTRPNFFPIHEADLAEIRREAIEETPETAFGAAYRIAHTIVESGLDDAGFAGVDADGRPMIDVTFIDGEKAIVARVVVIDVRRDS